MAITLNGSTGIATSGGYTGDGVSFADGTPSNTLVTTTGGDVGIGVAPTQRLHVSGSILGTQSVTIGSDGLYQAGSLYSDSNWGMILRAKQASPGQANFGFMNSAGLELMRIDSAGNLLVGTTASGGSGGLSVLPLAGGAGSPPAVIWNKSNTISETAASFRFNGSGVGTITYTNTGTSYNTTSDYRLKENVAPMQNALATVAALKPCTYTWKADGSAGQGFIAHELQAVVPDCVTGAKDAVETVDDLDAEGKKIGTKEVPRYQGVDTSFLVATLVAAIQELKAEVDALKGAA